MYLVETYLDTTYTVPNAIYVELDFWAFFSL